MTDRAQQLENVKQEIRSVLLTTPGGITLPALLKDYKSLVGQDLPFYRFGFGSVQDFIKAIPDVVNVRYSSRYNDYMLKAVADETTKHIEKLVSKQKVSKSASTSRRMPPARGMGGMGSTGPRFSRTHTAYNGRNFSRAELPPYLKQEIYAVSQQHKSGLSLPNFLAAYRRMYGKDLIFQNFGYYTLEDSLHTIPTILLRYEQGEMRVYPIIEKQYEETTNRISSEPRRLTHCPSRTVTGNKENHPMNNTSATDARVFTSYGKKPTENKTMDVLDNFTNQDEDSGNFGVSPYLREQFKKLIKEHPKGIWVSEFPKMLQKSCGHKLEHEKLGYYNLVDVFNDLPEIFRIEVMTGCSDDWMLYDATVTPRKREREGSDNKGPYAERKVSPNPFEVMEKTMKNIRLLLQANPEGIFLDDFCEVYKDNGEELDLNALGFDSLPPFLHSIEDEVPLIIDFLGKKPRVHIKETVSPEVTTRVVLPHEIPPDAVLRSAELETQRIPEDQKPDAFFSVYISHVVDPSHFYIQLRRKDASMQLENLMDELENFYYAEKKREPYRMPTDYIVPGAVCAALWPEDDKWHRVRIVSVPSNESVVAFYVDHGTQQQISSDNLMFLKKRFVELPAQAIRCHLLNLIPHQGSNWDPRAKEIVKSFKAMALQAYLTEKPVADESLPLIVCDVSGDDDVYLNDLLVSKNLARYEIDEESIANQVSPVSHDLQITEESRVPVSNQKPQISSTSQQAPVFPGSAAGNLLQIMSLVNDLSVRNFDAQDEHNPLLDSLRHAVASGNTSTQHPLLWRLLQQIGIDVNMLAKPGTASNVPMANSSGPSFGPSYVGVTGNGAPQRVSHESDSEVFESDDEIDDDDNPEVNSISKRYVKRITLDDGFSHVHMIVIDEKPYMSSGEITFLLFNNDDPTYVRRKLKNKEISIPQNTLSEIGYEQLFYQLGRFQVKGVKTGINGNNYITLFPFKNVIDILNIFGHPSVAVRDIIDDEFLHFNPSDRFWKTLSEEEFEESSVSIESNNGKDPKVCLYELKASLQALKFRKQTLKNQLYSSTSIPTLGDEIERIEIQSSEVERQIRELQIKVVSHQRERRFD